MKTYRNILVAGLGISPAILTETVWALGHEPEPITLDEIVVLTTPTGKAGLVENVIDSGVWDRMLQDLHTLGVATENRYRFGCAQDHIRLLPSRDGRHDTKDIFSHDDSIAAADFIMKTLREFTEDPETRVVASIAGGRKTMSALLMSCMTLLAREQDRVCHVLVSEPYDSPRMDPPFMYPREGVAHKLDDTVYRSEDTSLQLTDIPFVRMRGWYEERYRSLPTSYSVLVERFRGIRPKAMNYPDVKVDIGKGTLRIDDRAVALSGQEFAFMLALLRRFKGQRDIATWLDIGEDLEQMAEDDMPLDHVWFHDFCERGIDGKEDPRKIASRIRKKLARIDLTSGISDTLIPNLRDKGRKSYPAARIHIRPKE